MFSENFLEKKGELKKVELFKCCGESSSNLQVIPRHPLATGIGETLCTFTAYDSANCTYVLSCRRNAAISASPTKEESAYTLVNECSVRDYLPHAA